MTDAELVARVRQGDNEAYTQLVERYRNAIYGVAYHFLHNSEDARDVTQEAFIQAYLNLGQLREPAKFGPWLRQVTANQCRMWQRGQHSAASLEAAPPLAADTEQTDTRLALYQALACLSAPSRLTLTLFYFHSYSLQEIADFLEVPVTTVKSRLRDARARLRKEMPEMIEETLKPVPLPNDFPQQIQELLDAGKSGDKARVAQLLIAAKNGATLIAELTRQGHFQRFTETARHALFRGQQIAAKLNSAYVEPTHLLLGLLHENDSIATPILQAAGVTIAEVETLLPPMTIPHNDSEPANSPQTAQILLLAAEEAKQLAQTANTSNEIRPEHLLLGLLRAQENLAAQVLIQHGLTLEAVRAQIKSHL